MPSLHPQNQICNTRQHLSQDSQKTLQRSLHLRHPSHQQTSSPWPHQQNAKHTSTQKSTLQLPLKKATKSHPTQKLANTNQHRSQINPPISQTPNYDIEPTAMEKIIHTQHSCQHQKTFRLLLPKVKNHEAKKHPLEKQKSLIGEANTRQKTTAKNTHSRRRKHRKP